MSPPPDSFPPKTTHEELLARPFIRTAIRFASLRTGSVLFDEDLEQETILRVLQSLRRTEHIDYPKGFVMKIVRDSVADHWRHRHRFEQLDSLPERSFSIVSRLDEQIDERRKLVRIYRALARLSQSKRDTIELFYLSERSVGEIARLSSSSPSAVKMTLVRARQELRRMLHLSRSE